ncbi:unnamed protein product [Pedinophyceae sp. YPF-701]|nr:unnamed protein product [Pedinophyceae sp. YPF-701]
MAGPGTKSCAGLVLKRYEHLVHGRLIKRYKRFLADVRIGDEVVTVHCPNTGPMTGLLDRPEAPVLLSTSDNPKRKYRHTLEWIKPHREQDWVGVHSASANAMCSALLEAGAVSSFGSYMSIKREVVIRKGSRVDFALELEGGDVLPVEVKSVTLARLGAGSEVAAGDDGDNAEQPGPPGAPHETARHVAVFPDTVSLRAQKHVQELTEYAASGKAGAARAGLLLLVQRGDCAAFEPGWQHDRAYARLLCEAGAGGRVAVVAVACRLRREQGGGIAWRRWGRSLST